MKFISIEGAFSMCILVTALATIAISAALALFAYAKMTDYGTLPDDGNMSGPGY